jgi:ribosomal-protein-serine acetyltransferase
MPTKNKEQGKGIVTNCVKAICSYGFCTLNLNRIWLKCANLNHKSQAIPERIGFTKEGVLRDNEYLNGKYYDSFMYGILKRDWLSLDNTH